jgi:hypothetical protein
VVDKEGSIRKKWDGELRDNRFQTLTERIDTLLKE